MTHGIGRLSGFFCCEDLQTSFSVRSLSAIRHSRRLGERRFIVSQTMLVRYVGAVLLLAQSDVQSPEKTNSMSTMVL
jgi:hypothetical protein